METNYFSHYALVTTGNNLSKNISPYCTGVINTNENSKKLDKMNGSLHKGRKRACKNSKEERSQGLCFYSNNYFTEFENVCVKSSHMDFVTLNKHGF